MSFLEVLAAPNSNTLLFSGLTNGLEEFKGVVDPSVNDATGTATLLNEDGTDAGVAPATWVHVAGSKGDYYAQCPTTWPLAAGTNYKVRVALTTPGGLVLNRTYEVHAV